MGMVFCRGCGKEIHESAVTCPSCGATQGILNTPEMAIGIAKYYPLIQSCPT